MASLHPALVNLLSQTVQRVRTKDGFDLALTAKALTNLSQCAGRVCGASQKRLGVDEFLHNFGNLFRIESVEEQNPRRIHDDLFTVDLAVCMLDDCHGIRMSGNE